MNRTKQMVLSCILIITLVFSSTSLAFAADYAYSYGMSYKSSWLDFGEINTSGDVTNAASDFGIAGYSSYYNTSPSWSYVSGKNPNTNDYRIKSDIFFFSGHGTGGRVFFNYQSKDEAEYKFHITTNFVQNTSYHSLKLSDYSLSNVKLMTFAACQSANNGSGSQGNLLDTAVSKGAKAAVGWTRSVGVSDHTKWLKRYTNQLALGKTVRQAVDYANGFSDYSDKASVTSTIIKGNSSTTIKMSTTSLRAMNTASDTNTLYKDDNGFIRGISFANNSNNNLLLDAKDLKLSKVKDIIKEYLDIQIKPSNYKVSVQNIDETYSIIRFVETIKGYDTNSEIIVNVRNGQISSLFVNLKDANIDLLSNKKHKIVITDNEKGQIKKNLEEKITKRNHKVIGLTENTYYDCVTEKYVYTISYDSKHNIEGYDCKSIFSYDIMTGNEVDMQTNL